jgi:hypothetical protein
MGYEKQILGAALGVQSAAILADRKGRKRGK